MPKGPIEGNAPLVKKSPGNDSQTVPTAGQEKAGASICQYSPYGTEHWFAGQDDDCLLYNRPSHVYVLYK